MSCERQVQLVSSISRGSATHASTRGSASVRRASRDGRGAKLEEEEKSRYFRMYTTVMIESGDVRKLSGVERNRSSTAGYYVDHDRQTRATVPPRQAFPSSTRLVALRVLAFFNLQPTVLLPARFPPSALKPHLHSVISLPLHQPFTTFLMSGACAPPQRNLAFLRSRRSKTHFDFLQADRRRSR